MAAGPVVQSPAPLLVARAGTAARRPPDAFLVGVPRCGTTFLYHNLRQHPGVYAPAVKEVCFTCAELDPGVTKGSTSWIHRASDYFDLFAPARDDQLVLEGCTYNIYWPDAARAIAELNPAARILVLLRDPIEQMRSSHALKVLMADMPWDDFNVAIREQARARVGRAGLPASFSDYDLRDKALVSAGLEAFLRRFGPDDVRVVVAEDLRADPAGVYQDVARFLSVDPAFAPAESMAMPNRRARSMRLCRAMASAATIARAKRVVPQSLQPVARRAALTMFRANARAAPRAELEPALRDELRREFQPEVERLSQLVGRDLAARWWS